MILLIHVPNAIHINVIFELPVFITYLNAEQCGDCVTNIDLNNPSNDNSAQ